MERIEIDKGEWRETNKEDDSEEEEEYSHDERRRRFRNVLDFNVCSLYLYRVFPYMSAVLSVMYVFMSLSLYICLLFFTVSRCLSLAMSVFQCHYPCHFFQYLSLFCLPTRLIFVLLLHFLFFFSFSVYFYAPPCLWFIVGCFTVACDYFHLLTLFLCLCHTWCLSSLPSPCSVYVSLLSMAL